MKNPFLPGSFIWSLGIEDTCVYPPPGYEMEALNEYDLTGHTDNWRTDLRQAKSMGATAIRYGVNWPLVHTAPGVFDWAMLDERLHFACTELGLTVIADLVHYGTPTWLERAFADEGYPGAVAEFAGQFAARYRGIVDHITPLNEPLTTAAFCGYRGIWPPALTGWTGWTTVTLNIAVGVSQSVKAIRAANEDAIVVHVEASSLFDTEDETLESHADHLQALGMLPTDLLLGLVGEDHPYYSWLVDNGASRQTLTNLVAAAPRIDIVGVNYYPTLTPRALVTGKTGIEQLVTDGWTDGLATALRAFSSRYGLPLFVTETSIEGDDDLRARWLNDSVETIHNLRSDGLDIRGYTWWPMLDFVDWSYASQGRNIEEFHVDDVLVAARVDVAHTAHGIRSKTPFLRRLGMVRLDELDDGSLTRTLTTVADRFRHLTTAAAKLDRQNA